eukprot:CAMPEP_0172562166 /NCGR_PEP_ID=MMETSP1067-20121228/95854_1 /TAXON_ID=265564 ORGANISM="Thalassiosira punctigera, Strain Tpunct2005C2" /NCGR_SAMPLE_ID=MMETSP1067 /ASSEMBLY_ACC=CAM_ASM_000444 /LENGTH=51 /DNA_ID=CAMNT_0013352347 /DNA_START=529 /DNA_END=684 /DNA_ORIENTATION=-
MNINVIVRSFSIGIDNNSSCCHTGQHGGTAVTAAAVRGQRAHMRPDGGGPN